MKTPVIKFPLKFIFIVGMMIISLSLTACATAATATQENSPETAGDPQTKIFIPAVEADSKENVEKGAEDQAYPGTDQDIQNADISEPPQSEVTPESEIETQTPELKPTPRGNELVATNPTTVNLASGQPQLVELFTFW